MVEVSPTGRWIDRQRRSLSGTPEGIRSALRRFVPLFRPGDRVLDVGCGPGIFLSMLRDAGIEGDGVDLDPEAIQACRAAGFNRVFVADAHAYLRQTDQRYDGVFCSHLIEHLAFEDALSLLGGMGRVLRPGGKAVIVTPNPQDPRVIGHLFWLDPTHVRPYPAMLLSEMLDHVGFTVLEHGSYAGIGFHWREFWRSAIIALQQLRWIGINTYIIAEQHLNSEAL